jgi:hypothetical protein
VPKERKLTEVPCEVAPQYVAEFPNDTRVPAQHASKLLAGALFQRGVRE